MCEGVAIHQDTKSTHSHSKRIFRPTSDVLPPVLHNHLASHLWLPPPVCLLSFPLAIWSLKVTCEKAPGHALLLETLANNMVARLRINPDSALPDFQQPWPRSHLTNVTPHPGYHSGNGHQLWERRAERPRLSHPGNWRTEPEGGVWPDQWECCIQPPSADTRPMGGDIVSGELQCRRCYLVWEKEAPAPAEGKESFHEAWSMAAQSSPESGFLRCG